MRGGAAAIAAALALCAGGCGGDDGRDEAVGGLRVVQLSTGGAGVASGFSISGGRVVTAAHAVERATGTVRLTSGDRPRATVRCLDRARDLAVLTVPGLAGDTPPSARPAIGEVVQIVLPRREPLWARMRRALVARVHGPGGAVVERPAIELSTPVRPGDSGAPVLFAGGRLAGVVFARSGGEHPGTYAVAGSALTRLLAREDCRAAAPD